LQKHRNQTVVGRECKHEKDDDNGNIIANKNQRITESANESHGKGRFGKYGSIEDKDGAVV
jgi:hypothetical protein